MSHHIGIQVLRAKVRGFQAAGQSLSRLIAKATKERRHNLWNKKRELGTYARYHFIAYGLLRGIPYERIERCSKDNGPDPQRVLELMVAHSGVVEKTRADGRRVFGWAHYDLEKVKALLTVPDVPAAPAAASEQCLTATGGSPSPSTAHEQSLEKRA